MNLIERAIAKARRQKQDDTAWRERAIRDLGRETEDRLRRISQQLGFERNQARWVISVTDPWTASAVVTVDDLTFVYRDFQVCGDDADSHYRTLDVAHGVRPVAEIGRELVGYTRGMGDILLSLGRALDK
jgi:hypothetical protein